MKTLIRVNLEDDMLKEERCAKCGQKDDGQTGEYPCATCGLPTLHDELFS